MNLLEEHKEELKQACLDFQVDKLYAFGSILTDKFSPSSDIDFIVSISSSDPLEYAENYFELKFALENIFGRKIDLLEQKAIKNKVFQELVNQKKSSFMQEELQVWLEDIEKAILEIDEFLPEPRIFTEFQKELKTKRAVERNIEIIGEAMSRI